MGSVLATLIRLMHKNQRWIIICFAILFTLIITGAHEWLISSFPHHVLIVEINQWIPYLQGVTEKLLTVICFWLSTISIILLVLSLNLFPYSKLYKVLAKVLPENIVEKIAAKSGVFSICLQFQSITFFLLRISVLLILIIELLTPGYVSAMINRIDTIPVLSFGAIQFLWSLFALCLVTLNMLWTLVVSIPHYSYKKQEESIQKARLKSEVSSE